MKLERIKLLSSLIFGLLATTTNAFATDLKVTDIKGNEVIVKDAGIDYTPTGFGLVVISKEYQGIKAFQGEGVVTIKWSQIKTLTISGIDQTQVPHRLKGEIILNSGKTVSVDLKMSGENGLFGKTDLNGLFGKTDLNDFSIDLRDVKTIVPLKETNINMKGKGQRIKNNL